MLEAAAARGIPAVYLTQCSETRQQGAADTVTAPGARDVRPPDPNVKRQVGPRPVPRWRATRSRGGTSIRSGVCAVRGNAGILIVAPPLRRLLEGQEGVRPVLRPLPADRRWNFLFDVRVPRGQFLDADCAPARSVGGEASPDAGEGETAAVWGTMLTIHRLLEVRKWRPSKGSERAKCRSLAWAVASVAAPARSVSGAIQMASTSSPL